MATDTWWASTILTVVPLTADHHPMRILHVTHELPPYELAGTAIYSLNIARAQSQHHDVFIFARLQDPEIEAYRQSTELRDGCTIKFVNIADIAWTPFEDSYVDPKAERIFRDFVDEVRPDIIHFQHIVGLGAGTLDAVRELGIKTLFTLHDFWTMCPMGQRMCYTDNVICDPIDFGKCGPCVFGDGWQGLQGTETRDPGAEDVAEPKASGRGFSAYYGRRYAETPGRFARRPRAMVRAAQQTLRDLFSKNADDDGSLPFTESPFEHRFNVLREKLHQVDLLITPSAFLRDEFITHFSLSPTQIIHSANGMDFGYVKSLPKTPSDRLRFGFTGSIIPTKGVRVLVDGFIEAAKEHDDIALEVYGAPNRWTQSFLDELQAVADSSPCSDRITFHGRFDNKRVGEVLADMDVLVLPSIWFENAPLTLNEAAMTRTPVIVSDRGGMLEFARANNYGRTFELGNAHSLAEVMKELASDRSLVEGLAGNPPPIKSVARNAEELISVYQHLLGDSYVAPTLDEQTRTRGGCV